MQCHEVDYEVFGDDMQIVEVELDPGETVIAEAGAMSGVGMIGFYISIMLFILILTRKSKIL